MEKDLQKGMVFVSRLLQNPALSTLPVLQKEEQLLTFLKANANQLLPTLSSPNFFPGMSWQNIFGLLYQSLVKTINEVLFTQLEDILHKVDFSFTAFLRQQNFPLSKCRDQLFEFLKEQLNKYEVRRAFSGSLAAIQFNVVDRYIEHIYHRKEYVYFELTKVQRLKMSKEEVKNFIKVNLLLKNSIYLLTSEGSTDPALETGSGVIPRAYAEKVFSALVNKLFFLPEEVLKSSLFSNISFIDNKDVETTARVAAIFAARCRNYKVINQLDRGADFPDKSWFSIARRNFKFYGFDIKMLDELYRIAAENGW